MALGTGTVASIGLIGGASLYWDRCVGIGGPARVAPGRGDPAYL